jgi:two-component system response regulator
LRGLRHIYSLLTGGRKAGCWAIERLTMDVKPINILLVEDNQDHAELTVKVLKGNGLASNIDVARDGPEALDYLYNRGKYGDKKRYSRPDLVLLDINIPKIAGIEVLKRLKDDPEKKEMPVIMLTTSQDPKDITSAYMNGANSYISKPLNFAQFKEKLCDLQNYWALTNTLPK